MEANASKRAGSSTIYLENESTEFIADRIAIKDERYKPAV